MIPGRLPVMVGRLYLHHKHRLQHHCNHHILIIITSDTIVIIIIIQIIQLLEYVISVLLLIRCDC